MLGPYDKFPIVSPFSLSIVTMSLSNSTGVGRVDRWTRNATERRRENHYYDALAFSRHSINLVFDEENMKPDRLTKTLENAGIDPSTMRKSKRYHESTREDDDPHSPTSTRVSDIFTGVDKASYQVREAIENDEERLAMKRVICLHHCRSEMPIREFEKIKHCKNFVRTRTRCTVLILPTSSHKHGLITAELSSDNL